MAIEEKTLQCVQCQKEFPFTVEDQKFFADKGFESDPKRCKSCRALRRKEKRGQNFGEYRSPAFDRSAPAHQKRGARRGGGRRGGGPARGQSRVNREYRSPSFQGKQINAEAEYRSPGFRDRDHIINEQEYRSPGFKEYDKVKPEEEYRSPGFFDSKDSYKDEKPLFSIVCVACNKEAQVPFLPEEREDPMCQECYKEHQEMLKIEAAQESQKQPAEETAE